MRRCWIVLLMLAVNLSAAENPRELGRVAFGRDHDGAFARAKSESKPVLLLFQEIPG